MEWNEIKSIILQHGGKIEYGINWAWAVFKDDEKGKAAFKLIKPHVEHQGYCNRTGFRFR